MDVRGISRGEMVEAELNHLITRRHDRRVVEEGERAAHEAWHESEVRYFEEQRRAKDVDRYEFHLAQADRLRRTLGELVARHEAAAERLLPNAREGIA